MTDAVYLDRDNTVEYVLLEREQPVDLSAVTKIEVTVGAITVDSVADPTLVWTEEETRDVLGAERLVWVLKVMAGHITGLTAGRYLPRVTVYAADHPNGLVWEDEVVLKVSA